MKIKILDNNFDSKEYNKVVNHPLQSWEWGNARINTGNSIVRFGEFKNDLLNKAYLMTVHKIPFTNYKIGYIPRSTKPSIEFINYLSEFSKNNKIFFVKFEPNILKREPFDFKKLGLRRSSHPLFPEWTIVLNLSLSEDQLLKNLKSKTRYNINLAQKKGVIVKEESNQKGYKIFENLYFQTIKRQNYKGHNREYHKNIWESTNKTISHILIAYLDDQPLSAYQLFIFKNVCFYVYGGSSVKHRNLMASNLLMWKSILFAKNNKCKDLDMWGSLPKNYDPEHPWAGFTKFKEGYGGEFIEMVGSYDLIINPLLYSLYNVVYKIRSLFLRI